MELEIKRETVSSSHLVFDACAEQPVEADLILPDYNPDIAKILKCLVTPVVTSYSISNDRVDVEGYAKITVIYVGETEPCIKTYENRFDFSKKIEIKTEADFVCVGAKNDYVNCRAINSRRLSVTGAVQICVKAYAKRQEQLTVDAEGDGVQTKKEKLSLSSLCTHTVKDFVLSQELDLPESKPAFSTSVRCEAAIVITDCKIIPNKVIIRGDAYLHLLYCADDGRNTLTGVDLSLPVSQVIECDGIDEGCRNDLNVSVLCCEVTPRSDIGNSVNVELSARATVQAYKNDELLVVTDAFSTVYATEIKKKSVTSERFIEKKTTDTSAHVKVNVDAEGFRVIDAFAVLSGEKVMQQSDGLFVASRLSVCVIGEDHEGNVLFFERTEMVEVPIDKDNLPPSTAFSATVSVMGISYSSQGGNAVDLKVDLRVNVTASELLSVSYVDEITVKYDEKKACDEQVALCIYYADRGETVWDIAKRYNTSAQAIEQENNVEDGVISEGMMLLIPIV